MLDGWHSVLNIRQALHRMQANEAETSPTKKQVCVVHLLVVVGPCIVVSIAVQDKVSSPVECKLPVSPLVRNRTGEQS